MYIGETKHITKGKQSVDIKNLQKMTCAIFRVSKISIFSVKAVYSAAKRDTFVVWHMHENDFVYFNSISLVYLYLNFHLTAFILLCLHIYCFHYACLWVFSFSSWEHWKSVVHLKTHSRLQNLVSRFPTSLPFLCRYQPGNPIDFQPPYFPPPHYPHQPIDIHNLQVTDQYIQAVSWIVSWKASLKTPDCSDLQ